MVVFVAMPVCEQNQPKIHDALNFVWELKFSLYAQHRGSPRHTWRGHQFQGQKVKVQLVADVLYSQYASIGATWRINTKILSTSRGRRHIVAAVRLQLANIVTASGCSWDWCRSDDFFWGGS